MNRHSEDVFIRILFLFIIVGWVFCQIHLKKMPQIILLILGVFSLIGLVKKANSQAGKVFVLLISILLFIGLFQAIECMEDIISPNGLRSYIAENGIKHVIHPTMDNSFLWTIPLSATLAFLLVRYYFKKGSRSNYLEILFSSLFILVTIVIYLKREVLHIY